MARITLAEGASFPNNTFGGMRVVNKNGTRYLRKLSGKVFRPNIKIDINNYLNSKIYPLWQSLSAEQQHTFNCYASTNPNFMSGFHLFGHVNVSKSYSDLSKFILVRSYSPISYPLELPRIDEFSYSSFYNSFNLIVHHYTPSEYTVQIYNSVTSNPNPSNMPRPSLFRHFDSSISNFTINLPYYYENFYIHLALRSYDPDSGEKTDFSDFYTFWLE